MNLPSILLWGFVATIAMTTTISLAQSLGLTRIDMPFIVGTIFTSDRDRAKIAGLLFHIVNGLVFAFFYALLFENIHDADWWFGALLGAVQGLFILAVLLPVLPGVHPRMVSDFRGPEPTRLLEPPGFLAMNYGRLTPIVMIVAHTLYGLIIGMFYSLH